MATFKDELLGWCFLNVQLGILRFLSVSIPTQLFKIAVDIFCLHTTLFVAIVALKIFHMQSTFPPHYHRFFLFHQKVLISLLYIVLNNVVILVGYLKSNSIKVRSLCSTSKWRLLKDDCLDQIVSLEIATSFPRTSVQSGILSRHLYREKLRENRHLGQSWDKFSIITFDFLTGNAPQPKQWISLWPFFSHGKITLLREVHKIRRPVITCVRPWDNCLGAAAGGISRQISASFWAAKKSLHTIQTRIVPAMYKRYFRKCNVDLSLNKQFKSF